MTYLSYYWAFVTYYLPQFLGGYPRQFLCCLTKAGREFGFVYGAKKDLFRKISVNRDVGCFRVRRLKNPVGWAQGWAFLSGSLYK